MTDGGGAGASSTKLGVVVEDIMWRRFVRVRSSETVDDGLQAILVPRFDGALLSRILMPRLKNPFFRIRLDAFGSFVWAALDGESTVADVAERFAAANPDQSMALERVAVFVRTLAVQGHVAEVDGPPAACAPGRAEA